MKPSATIIIFPLLLALMPAIPAYAETREVDRQALLSLAHKFVKVVEKDFHRADQLVDTIDPQRKIQRSFDSLPDGEILLLQVVLNRGTGRERVDIPDPVMGVKEGSDVMVSLLDFISVARFAITIDAEKGKAEGWYARENQIFSLDMAARKVTVHDRSYDVADGDARIEDGDILVRGKALARWFDFTMTVNPGRQMAEIVSAQKWPPEEKAERIKRGKNSRVIQPPPSLPRQETPYQLASVPNVDVISLQSYKRPGIDKEDRGLGNVEQHVVFAGGDLLNHSGRAVLTGDDQDRILTGRLTLGRTSDKPDLLGSAKARAYQFLDVSTTSVPLTGASPGEIGFRMTNKDPYSSYDTTTVINGDGVPGWDVELYRDSQFVAIVTAGDDGRYEFRDVILFSGENTFLIVQYGPQGEIKEEQRTISVRPNLYNAEGGAYDVSVSFQNSQSYAKIPSEDNDRYQPHLAATYERQITPDLALRSGVRMRQENGKDRIYVQGGAVETFGGTVLNQDVAASTDGVWTTAAAARQTFGKHSIYGTAQYFGKDYNPNSTANRVPELRTNVAARGPLPDLIGKRSRYFADHRIVSRDDGSGQWAAGLGLATRIDRVTVSNRLSEQTNILKDGSDRERLDDTFALGGGAMGLTLRGIANYNIYPDREMKEYIASAGKRFSEDLDASFELKYQPPMNYKIGELSIDWKTEHATISPSIAYDSDRNVIVQMRTRTGFARNPYTGRMVTTYKSLYDKSGISARVFLDRDGDNVFSEGDELVPDVSVVAVHAHLSTVTDENGEAYIYDLPTNKITDVIVEEGSVFDPTWVVAFKGVSIRPRPGHVERIEFPLHVSGEVDGTVYAVQSGGKENPLRNITLQLYRMNGKPEQRVKTANDGFYLFSRIPPGRYYLMIDPDDAAKANIRRPVPQEIAIGFDGTVIYANDIRVEAKTDDIPLVFLSDRAQEEFARDNPSLDPGLLGKGGIALNLGSYNSRLLTAVVWYRLKTRYAQILRGAQPLVQPSQSFALVSTGQHALRVSYPNGSVRSAYAGCRALMARGFHCAVEMLPDQGPKEAMADSSGKG